MEFFTVAIDFRCLANRAFAVPLSVWLLLCFEPVLSHEFWGWVCDGFRSVHMQSEIQHHRHLHGSFSKTSLNPILHDCWASFSAAPPEH